MGSKDLERTGHDVIAYDARGHGQSDPGEAYTYELLAADLLAVLDQTGVERAVLAGASMGAHTAIKVALDAPERVAGLVVLTPGFEPEDHAHPTVLARWDALAAGLREGGVDGFVEAYGSPSASEQWRATLVTVLRQRMAAHAHLQAVADAIEQVPRSVPYGSLAELASIDCPVRVVGTRDDPDPGHPLALARRYAEALATDLVVEDEGRSPVAWQGGRVSKLIAEVAAAAR